MKQRNLHHSITHNQVNCQFDQLTHINRYDRISPALVQMRVTKHLEMPEYPEAFTPAQIDQEIGDPLFDLPSLVFSGEFLHSCTMLGCEHRSC